MLQVLGFLEFFMPCKWNSCCHLLTHTLSVMIAFWALPSGFPLTSLFSRFLCGAYSSAVFSPKYHAFIILFAGCSPLTSAVFCISPYLLSNLFACHSYLITSPPHLYSLFSLACWVFSLTSAIFSHFCGMLLLCSVMSTLQFLVSYCVIKVNIGC